ncbi:MAG: SAM-dependent methyltransferase [Sinobacteraceae bacterium]|nr:SAM-dependent methyltransferase [Nevskiaceae bacterium]
MTWCPPSAPICLPFRSCTDQTPALLSWRRRSACGEPPPRRKLPATVTPLITLELQQQLATARRTGSDVLDCSLDLGRSRTQVRPSAAHWSWEDARFPYLQECRERSIYYWSGTQFQVAARYSGALIKLIPTCWGAPTFEIDGIKMLPSERVSPYEDAAQKVRLITPRGKIILDTCGGLGYFAASCLSAGAASVLSFEKNDAVLWLRTLNPWSPGADARLKLALGDISAEIRQLPDASVDAILHDPPRFGIAGELYARSFYDELYRVLKRRGRLFHYTGNPNMITSGRNVPREVSRRLSAAGFEPQIRGDAVLASKA